MPSRLMETKMTSSTSGEAAKAVVRRNTEEVQGKGNFRRLRGALRRRLRRPYAAAQHDSRQARGAGMYQALRQAFPDFHSSLADRRWRDRDDLQDISRYASGNVPGRRADRPQDPLRNCRRHARARRKDRRALGCGEPLLADAAARGLRLRDKSLEWCLVTQDLPCRSSSVPVADNPPRPSS